MDCYLRGCLTAALVVTVSILKCYIRPTPGPLVGFPPNNVFSFLYCSSCLQFLSAQPGVELLVTSGIDDRVGVLRAHRT